MISSPQDLVASLSSTDAKAPEVVPKIVWMFWNTGEASAPEVATRAIATWRTFNPDHEVRVLDEASLAEDFGIDYQAMSRHYSVALGEASRSDIIRMYLLLRFGGVWADASTFCLNPLSDWLHPQLAESGLFLFRIPKKYRDRQIANWFMAARPGNPIIKEVLERSVAYLTRPRPKPLKIAMLRRIAPPKALVGHATTGYPLLDFAEQKGLAPYFLNHYHFNEAIALYPGIWEKVAAQSNRFAHSRTKFEQFLAADVAKLNRRPGYTSGTLFANRMDVLFDGSEPSLARLNEARAQRGIAGA